MDHPRTVLDFWFGREPMTPALFAAKMPEWFGGRDADTRAARDATITSQFGVLAARAAAGALVGPELEHVAQHRDLAAT